MVISIAVVIVRPYNQGLQPKARKHKSIVFITGGLEGNSNSWGLLRRTPGEPNHPPTVSALWPLRSGGTFLNIFLCLSRKCSWWSGVWTHLTVHWLYHSTLRGSIPGCSFSDWQQWGGRRVDWGALGELRHNTQPQSGTTSCQGQDTPLPSPPVLSF